MMIMNTCTITSYIKSGLTGSNIKPRMATHIGFDLWSEGPGFASCVGCCGVNSGAFNQGWGPSTWECTWVQVRVHANFMSTSKST